MLQYCYEHNKENATTLWWKKHKFQLVKWKEGEMKQSRVISKINEQQSEIANKLTPEVIEFFRDALKNIEKANPSFESFGEVIPWINKISQDGLSIGNVHELQGILNKLFKHH